MSVDGYSKTQIRLHWIVAVLLVPQFLLAGAMADAFRNGLETGTYNVSAPVIGHVIGGVLILALVIWRLAVRARRGAPLPPAQEPIWQKVAAQSVHLSLYGALILLPLSGIAAWALEAEGAANTHGLLRVVLIALVTVHVLGALVSHFGQKSGVITRMMKPNP